MSDSVKILDAQWNMKLTGSFPKLTCLYIEF